MGTMHGQGSGSPMNRGRPCLFYFRQESSQRFEVGSLNFVAGRFRTRQWRLEDFQPWWKGKTVCSDPWVIRVLWAARHQVAAGQGATTATTAFYWATWKSSGQSRLQPEGRALPHLVRSAQAGWTGNKPQAASLKHLKPLG
ncbi:hypothetical protein CIHG_03630 [Coccidioides immitis H538.4]|uniref:Uncharacterized protein n=2 Tax=Coccidioides immitis TaxID=5501 RepID=A0A0J8RNK3_COCIT|nr:hypothetical protein CIRG_04818 [Coccidioides immitis RMSCC 2394]KMU85589.1 hypothetical protein CIHG_03630 [Coccidioides immitis H538.4]